MIQWCPQSFSTCVDHAQKNCFVRFSTLKMQIPHFYSKYCSPRFLLPLCKWFLNHFRLVPKKTIYTRELAYHNCMYSYLHTWSRDCNRPIKGLSKKFQIWPNPLCLWLWFMGERRKGAGCVCGLGQGLWKYKRSCVHHVPLQPPVLRCLWSVHLLTPFFRGLRLVILLKGQFTQMTGKHIFSLNTSCISSYQ